MDMNTAERPKRILRAQAVQSKIGCGNSKFYQMLADGEFPPGIRIGRKSVGWIESVVDDWISSRPTVDLRKTTKTSTTEAV
jgi:predicted DNA-binding transcriptional regulator AlpA